MALHDEEKKHLLQTVKVVRNQWNLDKLIKQSNIFYVFKFEKNNNILFSNFSSQKTLHYCNYKIRFCFCQNKHLPRNKTLISYESYVSQSLLRLFLNIFLSECLAKLTEIEDGVIDNRIVKSLRIDKYREKVSFLYSSLWSM